MQCNTACPLYPRKRTLNSPKVPKAGRRKLCVANCVLDVAVAEISLQRSRIVSPIRKRVTTSVPKHVGVCLEKELGLNPRPFDHASEPGGAEGGPTLRGEHKGRLGLLLPLEPSKGPQLVPEDWVGAGRTLLHPAYVKRPRCKLNLVRSTSSEARRPCR